MNNTFLNFIVLNNYPSGFVWKRVLLRIQAGRCIFTFGAMIYYFSIHEKFKGFSEEFYEMKTSKLDK